MTTSSAPLLPPADEARAATRGLAAGRRHTTLGEKALRSKLDAANKAAAGGKWTLSSWLAKVIPHALAHNFGVICCVVITLYLGLGTLAFYFLEPSWLTSEALYFSVVTLTTVRLCVPSPLLIYSRTLLRPRC